MRGLRLSCTLILLGGCAEMAPAGGASKAHSRVRYEAVAPAAVDEGPAERAAAPGPRTRKAPEDRPAPPPRPGPSPASKSPGASPASPGSKVGFVALPSSGGEATRSAPVSDKKRTRAKSKKPRRDSAHEVPAKEEVAIDDLSATRRLPEPAAGLSARPAPGPLPRRGPPKSPGLSAGAADDNLSFGAFLRFLEDSAGQTPVPHDVASRVVVTVQDREGRPVHDARVTLRGGPRQVRRTYPDGRTLVFPPARAAGQGPSLEVRYGRARRVLALAPGRRRVTVKLDVTRPRRARVPLDVAFVLDTTGSMDDELTRLKKTIDVIDFQIRNLHPQPDVRFGMVLYRDVGDDYRTREVPFTKDLDVFRRALAQVRAGGGNDYPEDVQEGLRVAMQKLEWREHGVRLAFLIGDAPPHTDYGQAYTYVSAMKEAARRGIKIATIGASGLSREGEVAWRQIAQFTMAPFVFLTSGEKGDSEGSPSTVSHHVGSNWVAQNLDAIVVRLVKSELAHLTPRGAPERRDYFSAATSARLPADHVLEDLFSRSVRQLVDYAVQRLDPRTPTVVLPLTGKLAAPRRAKLARRLEVGLARAPTFQLVEREGKARLLETLAGQLGETYDAAKAAEVGRLVPARLAVLGHVARAKPGKTELLVKLVRLETGEVLSLSLLEIEDALLM